MRAVDLPIADGHHIGGESAHASHRPVGQKRVVARRAAGISPLLVLLIQKGSGRFAAQVAAGDRAGLSSQVGGPLARLQFLLRRSQRRRMAQHPVHFLRRGARDRRGLHDVGGKRLAILWIKTDARLGQDEGLFQESIEKFKRSLEINPGSWRAYFNMAGSYAQLRLVKEACEALDSAFSLFPDVVDKVRTVLAFDPIRDDPMFRQWLREHEGRKT